MDSLFDAAFNPVPIIPIAWHEIQASVEQIWGATDVGRREGPVTEIPPAPHYIGELE